MEQTIGHLHNVVFGESRHLLAVIADGVLEGVTHDLLATGTGDELETLIDFIRLPVLDTCVEVFFIFADDDQIHDRMLGPHVGAVAHAGAHIGIKAQRLAGGHIDALEARSLWRRQRGFVEDFGGAL